MYWKLLDNNTCGSVWTLTYEYVHLVVHIFASFIWKNALILVDEYHLSNMAATFYTVLPKILFSTQTLRFRFKPINNEAITGNIYEIISCM